MISTKLKVLCLCRWTKDSVLPQGDWNWNGGAGWNVKVTSFPLKAEWLEIAEWLCCKSAVSEPQVAETELYRCALLQCSALGQAAGSQVLLPPGRVWEYSLEYPQDSGAGGICAGFRGALHWELLLPSPDLCATALERAELLLPQLPLCVGHTSVPRGLD